MCELAGGRAVLAPFGSIRPRWEGSTARWNARTQRDDATPVCSTLHLISLVGQHTTKGMMQPLPDLPTCHRFGCAMLAAAAAASGPKAAGEKTATGDGKAELEAMLAVSHGLQLQSLVIIPTAAVSEDGVSPVENPHCSCELTRVRGRARCCYGRSARPPRQPGPQELHTERHVAPPRSSTRRPRPLATARVTAQHLLFLCVFAAFPRCRLRGFVSAFLSVTTAHWDRTPLLKRGVEGRF